MFQQWSKLILLAAAMSVGCCAAVVKGSAPRLIRIEAGPLSSTQYLDNWEENLKLMSSLSEQPVIARAELEGRANVQLSLFWGPGWVSYVEAGANIHELTSAQANQKARFYPALGRQPAALVFEDMSSSGRVVSAKGKAILKRHGVIVDQFDRTSFLKAIVVFGAVSALLLPLILRELRS
jgi:hypothetical protein